MNKFLQYVVTVALLCLCSGTVMAQNSSLISCQNATSLTNLNSSFTGIWFEASRSPASAASCVGLNITTNGTAFSFSITSASNSSALYSNATSTYPLLNSTITPLTTNLSAQSTFIAPPGGFYYLPQANENVTVKVVMTDYTNVAFICGYSNTTNSSFGAILTRQRAVTSGILSTYAAMVNSNYTNFSNLTAVTQSAACYQRNSAASHASVLSLIFAVVYATLKFLN
ncbi:uncharacterized protein LOC118745999 [Rhagoletis pomonella]|uniref:uncharacterized protein LOC118745999 n=1 Tax=Rhagoletis pomonella TaxID=28610 RepID=UPI00178205C5|nr:uncharacterized protein LOC118745999 [Rhagoletis pomonella]